MSYPDPIEALVTLLAADAGVAALAGTRVFGVELPRAEADAMPRKSLLLRPAPAIQRPIDTVPLDRIAVDVFAYGETPYQAAALSRAAHLALKAMRRSVVGSALLLAAWRVGGPIVIRDPSKDWPAQVETWAVDVAECEVA